MNATVWEIPIVNHGALYQAIVNAAHGSFNQILYWSRPAEWFYELRKPRPQRTPAMARR
jgi:hypothetical protein